MLKLIIQVYMVKSIWYTPDFGFIISGECVENLDLFTGRGTQGVLSIGNVNFASTTVSLQVCLKLKKSPFTSWTSTFGLCLNLTNYTQIIDLRQPNKLRLRSNIITFHFLPSESKFMFFSLFFNWNTILKVKEKGVNTLEYISPNLSLNN